MSENQPRTLNMLSMHNVIPRGARRSSDCSQTKTLHQSALAIAWVRRSLSIPREGDCYFQVTPLFSRFCRLILGCSQRIPRLIMHVSSFRKHEVSNTSDGGLSRDQQVFRAQ